MNKKTFKQRLRSILGIENEKKDKIEEEVKNLKEEIRSEG